MPDSQQSSSGTQGLRRLYRVLEHYEQEKTSFSLEELAEACGYRLSTIRTYVTKKLKNIVRKSAEKKHLFTASLGGMEEEAFVHHMSQTCQDETPAEEEDLAGIFRKCSLDSCLLAVELYNRPRLPNRTEAFCIMMAHAWELLLKSLQVKQEDEDAPLPHPRLLELVRRQWPDGRNPVRRNLECLVELRNQAMHFILRSPDRHRDMARLFQANVLNYLQSYREIDAEGLLARLQPGFVALLVDVPETEPGVLKIRPGRDLQAELDSFWERFDQEERTFAEEGKAMEFAIPVEYRLVLTRNEREGDLNLTR